MPEWTKQPERDRAAEPVATFGAGTNQSGQLPIYASVGTLHDGQS
jgi:hypothetical protein